MKSYLGIKILSISLFISVMLLQGCKKEEVDIRQAMVIQGLVYKLHDKEPFTGKINNVAGSYFSDLARLKYLSITPKHFGTFWPSFNRSDAKCVLTVTQGIFDGPAECKIGEQIVYKGEFVKGLKQGNEEFIATIRKCFPMEPERSILYINNWNGGIKHGTEEIYLLPLDILLEQTNWHNGKKQGTEKRWTLDGKLLLADLNWSNNKKTGFERSLDDGDQTCTYQDGQEIHCIKKTYSIVKDENGNFDLHNYKTFLYSISTKDNVNQSIIYEQYNQLGKLVYKKSQIANFDNASYTFTRHNWQWEGEVLRKETIVDELRRSVVGYTNKEIEERDSTEIIYYDESEQLVAKEFYENGHLTKKEQFQNGKLVNASMTNKKETTAKDTSKKIAICIENAINYIRNEVGDEYIITADQLTEIENNCQPQQ